MSELPRISVVTACFNAQDHVEATLHSVLQQDYSKLDYVFIDAASKDGTLAIAQRYRGGLSQLVCEPDEGQYHGIQKGLSLATGEVMSWLNGDDVHCPWTLSVVGEVFARFPEVQWLVGTPSYMNEGGQCTRVSGNSGNAYPRDYIRKGWFRPAFAGYLQQESMFWRRSLWQRVGGLDLDLRLAADFDLWRRFAEHAELHSLTVPLSLFRQRPGVQRSSASKADYEGEVDRVCAALPQPPAAWRWLSRQGEAARHLARLAVWKPAPVISYAQSTQQWVLSRSRRPLARTSLADLMLEQQVRRKHAH
jgi:hypothetical protein